MRSFLNGVVPRAILSIVLCFPLADSLCLSAEIYVAPDGNDQNPGTRQSPVATLLRARDLGRQTKKADEPLSIILRGGTYYLPQTLVLEAEDSGTAAGPVVFPGCPRRKRSDQRRAAIGVERGPIPARRASKRPLCRE